MKFVDRIIDALKLYEYDDEPIIDEKVQVEEEPKEKNPLFRKKVYNAPAVSAETAAPVAADEPKQKKSFFGFGKKKEAASAEQPAPAEKMGSRTINLPIANKLINVVVIEPTSFDDSPKIADYLRKGQPVVVNFENTDSVLAMRMADFISGTIYAVGGSVKKLSRTILVCAPKNVDIDAEHEEPAERGGQLWKK